MYLYINKVTSNSLTIQVDKGSSEEVTYDVAVYKRSISNTNKVWKITGQRFKSNWEGNPLTITKLKPETKYIIQAWCHETNIAISRTQTTKSVHIMEGIKGDDGVKSITISVGSNSNSTTSSNNSVSMEVDNGSDVTWSYDFKSGYEFDKLVTSEGNTSYGATNKYTYSSVQGNLNVTIYSKHKTVIAKAVSATEGVKIKVSGIDAYGDAISAVAEYGSSALIKVAIGSKVTWSVDTAGGYPQFLIELSNKNYATRLLSNATFDYGPLEANLTVTYTGKPLQFGWTYHACDINNSSKWLDVAKTGNPAYKWNQATAESTTNYKSYYGFLVTADEWTQVQSYVNELRASQGLIKKDFTKVKKGDKITAKIFNEVITALDACRPSITLESATSGSPCTAKHFNLIMNAINSLAKE